MKLKAKKFSRKLLALVMALVMGITCFSGTFSAFAAASSSTKYFDGDVEYNGIAWGILSNEQVCSALLDYADEALAVAGPKLESGLATMLKQNKDLRDVLIYDLSSHTFTVHYLVDVGKFTLRLCSVNEIMASLASLETDFLHGTLIGIAKTFADLGAIENIDFRAFKGMTRENSTSTEIVQALFGLIQMNISESQNDTSDAVLSQLLKGTFSLGALNSVADVYGIVGGLFGGMPSGYQSNFVYNVVKGLIFSMTQWYTDEEKQGYWDNPSTFVFDDQLLNKMTTELLDKISVLVTYPNEVLDIETNPESANYGQPKLNEQNQTYSVKDNSCIRYTKIDCYMKANNATWEQACAALTASEGVTYDPLLRYSEEEKFTGNVLLFAYGDEMIQLNATDSLFAFGYQALRLAWNTVLSDTVNLLQINYDVDRGHGSNFDNAYYGWATSKGSNNQSRVNWIADINDPHFADNYSPANIQAWANDVYASYKAESPTQFLEWVKNNFEFDRVGKPDSTGEYDDIEASTMFNKIRYSPLADFGFNMQTGPINLFFRMTGATNLHSFFSDDYSSYASLVAGLNDALVAACKDIFVNRANIGKGTVKVTGQDPVIAGDDVVTMKPETNLTAPSLTKKNTETTSQIASTLVGNATKLIQYTADAMDVNVLKKFYTKNGASATLSESNLETAMLPLLMSLVGQINLNGYKLKDCIHPEDWAAVNDAEALVFLCLEEYLSYILPDKDYRGVLVNVNANSITAKRDIDGDGNATMLNDVLLVMARDAVAYVMQGFVPFNGVDGNPWYPDARDIDDASTLFDLLNSVICYYAGDYTFSKTNTSNGLSYARSNREKALGLAALFGICEGNKNSANYGKSLIVESNGLWGNLDIIVNHFFPLAGVLTGEGSKNFHSQPLIWDTIVVGILDIGPNQGVTNFIDKLLSIVCAAPIKSTSIICSVYDVLQGLVNAVFGPRYSDQTWVPVPDRTSAHPFNDFLDVNIIAGGTSKTSMGAIQKVFANLAEFVGFSNNQKNVYPDTVTPGIAFAFQAINSFTNLLPVIGEQQLAVPSADFKDDIVGGQTSVTSNVTVKNISTGINLAYVDRSKSINQQVTQLSRYTIRVTGTRIETVGTAGTATIANANNNIIKPGESVSFSTTSNISGDESLFKVTITYDVGLMNGNTFNATQTGLTTYTYQYMNNAADYVKTVYPRSDSSNGGLGWFSSAAESSLNPGGGITINKTAQIDNLFTIYYPNYVIAKTDDLSAVDNYGVRHKKDKGINTKSIDGCYYWDSGTVIDGTTGGSVNLNSAYPKVYCDPETGGFVQFGTYDYTLNDGASWTSGVSMADAENAYKTAVQQNGADNVQFRTRDHVIYDVTTAKNNGIWVAAVKNEKGLYECAYMKQGSNSGEFKMDNLLSAVSLYGPAKGFTVDGARCKSTVKNSQSAYASFLKYDGVTDPADMELGKEITARVAWYRNGQNVTGTYTFIVADTGAKTEVQDKIAEFENTLAYYSENDFDSSTNAVGIAESALAFALRQVGAPITKANAASIGDQTEKRYNVKTVTSAKGDAANIPLVDDDGNAATRPANLPLNIYKDAYLNSANNVWYYDKELTAPIYTPTRMTGNNSAGYTKTEGGVLKDICGMPIVLGSDNKYNYVNDINLDSDWETGMFTAPFRSTIGKGQWTVTNNDGSVTKYYDEVQFSYYDNNGGKVTSNSIYAVKVADTSYQRKPITASSGDTRGIISQANDYLNYAKDIIEESLDESIFLPLVNDISIKRFGMNSANFDVLTYEKMTDIAQAAERNYTMDITYRYAENVKDANKQDVKATDPVTGEEYIVTQIVTKTAKEISFSDYKKYGGDNIVKAKAADGTVTEVPAITIDKVHSTLSSIQVNEYVRLFNFYAQIVYERGYKGQQIQPEIICAGGAPFGSFTVTPATESTNATVSANGVTAPFGKYEGGQLVNKGAIIYPAKLWTNYVNALANAVAIAQNGNGSYAYKNAAPYQIANSKQYTAQVTDTYSAYTDLRAAEIALEKCYAVDISITGNGSVIVGEDTYTESVTVGVVDGTWTDFAAVADEGYVVDSATVDGEDMWIGEDGVARYAEKVIKDTSIAVVFAEESVQPPQPTTITISGTATIANTAQGGDSGLGIRNVNIMIGGTLVNGHYEGGTVIGTTSDLQNQFGQFTVEVPVGTTEIAFVGDLVVDRVVTLNGDADVSGAVVPIVMGDFTGDLLINLFDYSRFMTYYNGGFSVFADYTDDDVVNIFDYSRFMTLYGTTVEYTALALD